MKITFEEILKVDAPLFHKAYEIAKFAHRNQKRRSGEPYINHCERVVENVFDDFDRTIKNIDNRWFDVLCVAILHDAFEDNPEECSLEYIRIELNKVFVDDFWRVTTIIRAIKAISKKSKGEESYIDYVLRVKEDIYARITKIADLTDNMSDLEDGNLKQKYELTKYFLEN